MAIATQKYIRKPLYVDAVRINVKNFDEVAAWCQGEIQTDEESGGKRFIKVRVHNPKNPRQTKAFVGDWLLYTERGYKVYTNKPFHASFDRVEDVQDQEGSIHTPEEPQPKSSQYPYQDGDVVVLGPGVFVDRAAGVLNWEGQNYVMQPRAGKSILEGVEELRSEGATIEEVAQPGSSVSAAGPVDVEVEVKRQMTEGLQSRIGDPYRDPTGGIRNIDVLKPSDEPETPIAPPPTPKIAPPPKQVAEALLEHPDVRKGLGLPETTRASESAQRDMPPEKRMPEPQPVMRSVPEPTVDDVPDQESIEPAAAEGKRVLSVKEQREMTSHEVRELIQSGEVVLAQDLAQP